MEIGIVNDCSGHRRRSVWIGLAATPAGFENRQARRRRDPRLSLKSRHPLARTSQRRRCSELPSRHMWATTWSSRQAGPHDENREAGVLTAVRVTFVPTG